ncbi:MAG: hypothetical protein JWM95_4650 [Gemmatimonadetes bacterium]|nr:hypothetical protein [Gemmatimonadota bacterium]
MAYRIFRDSRGREWQTWDVTPSLGERRIGERRMYSVAFHHEDLRSRNERRATGGHRPLMTAGLDTGWLCFEAADEKRRLAPVPNDWQVCPRERLEEYCERATVARRATGGLRNIDLKL